MKNITNSYSSLLYIALFLTSLVFFSSCSSQKQYFSFTPAPPAYVKKPLAPAVADAPAVTTTPTETGNTETENPPLTASAAVPAQSVVLPEVAALREANAPKTAPGVKKITAAQKLTLTQKVVLHKVQKQVKKLSNQAQVAAGPVSNRNAIALILIGVVLAVFATLLTAKLASLFYTLGVLLLLVGLVLLILNYV